MNIFRFAGDMTHLFSVLVLLLKIYATKSCSGISLKTQELYVVVFVTRYLDLFTNFVSLYNTVMKLVFIGSSVLIVWWMRAHPLVRRSYDKELDTFRHYFLIAGCFALALLFNESFTFVEVFWTFSIYLEAVAILPQLVLLQRSGNVDNLTGQYVFFLGYGFLEDILKEVCIQFQTTFASKNCLGVVNVQFPSFHLGVSHRVDSPSPKSVEAVEQVGKMYKKWLVSQNLRNSTHSHSSGPTLLRNLLVWFLCWMLQHCGTHLM